ncbi:three component ABC system middle component [Massilia brevitalea]|uniref:three component ABC system middle component n=1 Tax=Massilia brevitalea TaxID=442526 RepID=UPI00273943B4|nr:three component ABC system middle component [Massilia brevitalea]
MIDWSTRPFEERNLFNPAFCALILAAAIREYERVAVKPMPYSLTLLVLPLCLHQSTRDQILGSKRVSVLRIVALQPDLLVDFAERARSLVQYTTEAFALLASKGCITVSDDGGIHLIPRRVSSQALSTDDAEMCRNAATVLGRDFAQINDRVTIYTSLSIRP